MSDFSAALKIADDPDTSAWLDGIYRELFGDVASIGRTESGKYAAQENGVDVVIFLKRDKTVRVEEKVRTRDFGDDVLLEIYSNEERKTPGWLLKPYTADFIAYAVPAARRCLLLPVLMLRRAWSVNGRDWYRLAKHNAEGLSLRRGTTDSHGGGVLYQTLNIAVPTGRLLAAIGEACRSSSAPGVNAPVPAEVREVIDGFVF